MENKNDFKPYISAEKAPSEISLTSIITGIILAVVFGAANAYLGLRVGMTVSASIPAAVIAMGVIRVILRKNSVLESNMVQTTGSAGESVAAGAIFTLPTLFLWASEGKIAKPTLLEITSISLIGGLLGVFFMIPLRKPLIVKEHNVLPYPEGTACAEVLLAGEEGSKSASVVFSGLGLSAFYKLIIDGLKLASGEIILKIKGFAGEIGTQIYPAVLSVGYICGPKISSYMFSGGILSWLVLIPLIVLFGSDAAISPAAASIGELYQSGGAYAIWSNYIRYIGAGALSAGGIISLIKALPLIFKTFGGAIKSIKGSSITNSGSINRTSKDLGGGFVLISVLLLTLIIWLIPSIPVNIWGALIIVVFGFFFATVSSRMVGLVGSSNNPVSGMAIATLIVASLILLVTGQGGINGQRSAIAIGSIICIIAAIAGDTSQDLKTGYLLGATPKKQQIGEIIGVVAASMAIGVTLYLLDYAWGFGSEEIAAPQATLMKMIVEGVMGGNLPWELVFVGIFIAVCAEVLGVPVLPFAIGVYLPVSLNACIMFGGLIRFAAEHISKKRNMGNAAVNRGILFCSGMIAGEGLIGIFLAILAIFGADKFMDLSAMIGLSLPLMNVFGVILFGLIILSVLRLTLKKEKI